MKMKPKTRLSKKGILIAFLSGALTVFVMEYLGYIYPSLRSRFFYFLARVNRWLSANRTIEEQREVVDLVRRVILREPEDLRGQFVVEGVPVQWVLPAAEIDENCVILYLHGGAYVQRTPIFHHRYTTNLANVTKTRVLLVDYRLAPEHPFPAALEDAYAAYNWLLQQNYAPNKIVIAGDSAGGGLAVATLINARDHALPLPACAVLMSPWLDLAGTGNSIIRLAATDPQLSWENLEKSAQSYYGSHSPTNPLISPLYADLRGLPPILIIAGGAEILLDDSIRFADRASVADVDVDLVVEPNMGHVWSIFDMVIPEAQVANRITSDFIQSIVHPE